MHRSAMLCASAVVLAACTVSHEPVAPQNTLSLIPKPPPPSEFRVSVLASPDTVNSYALAINATGFIVGTIDTRQLGGPFIGVVWDTTGIPVPLTDGLGMAPADISDYGAIIANRAGESWVYLTAQARVRLPMPPGAISAVTAAINWQDIVVGEMLNAKSQRIAVRWDRATSKQWTASVLPVSSQWEESGARDINALGDISGWVRTGAGGYHAWVWLANGTQVDVGKIVSLDGLRINNKQFVLLHGYGVSGSTKVQVVNAPSGILEPQTSPPSGTTMNALNDAGRLVGVSPVSIRYGNAFASVPVTVMLRSARPADDLPFSTSIGVTPGGNASDVNLCGTVVGNLRQLRNGFRRAVTWLRVDGGCDPDPTPVLRVAK